MVLTVQASKGPGEFQEACQHLRGSEESCCEAALIYHDSQVSYGFDTTVLIFKSKLKTRGWHTQW